MNSGINSCVWERINWRRVVLVTLFIPAVAFVLVVVAACQGDSDLPPYNPATATERVCVVALSILVWPAFAVGNWVGSEGVGLLLFMFSGLAWAVLVEGLSIAKNTWRA